MYIVCMYVCVCVFVWLIVSQRKNTSLLSEYIFTRRHEQNVTQGQFLSGVHWFEFRVFLLQD